MHILAHFTRLITNKLILEKNIPIGQLEKMEIRKMFKISQFID